MPTDPTPPATVSSVSSAASLGAAAAAGGPAPYDALLLVSFGGPERSEDVMPFLRNVTRGRGIPQERLEDVAEHYYHFGGASPIQAQCRDLLAAVRADLAAHQVDLPVYWGNRNWDPLLTDTLAQMASDGVRRAAAFVTSAYSSYSGCRQYRENLADALRPLGAGAPRVDKLRHYFNHPGFIEPQVDAVLAALGRLSEPVAGGAEIVFVTHSIPTAMDEASGPDGGAYQRQHLDVAATVAAQVAARTGLDRPWTLAYCSRSGPPAQPWLEPDVNDHLATVATRASAAVLVPIGFISDHMEVAYDLDVEATETAQRLGLPVQRAATVGTDQRFIAAVRDLLLERASLERGVGVSRVVAGRLPASHDVCPVGCCRNLRDPQRPAAAGAEAWS